ncbi:MAG: hypothetical protein IK137_02590 [Bacilli bacterium]|nr:hypothetical protein [Bacilli bacterium]
MKRLNNKGFAISTFIYGLAIMGVMIVAILLATMAQTRSNTKSIVKGIEEDLNRYSRTETSFKPVGDTITAQEYVVPESGWYRIELWGTQGGGNGGKGAYTGGVIELVEGESLYFYVGKHKSSGGGYASEVRIVNGLYNDSYSYETRIMVAAGGGSESTALGGTLYGYNDKMNSYGGLIKASGNNRDLSLISTTEEINNTNGTLLGYNKNYAVSTATYPTANVNAPSPVSSNSGGDGYFPSNNASTGGTSFIAGYAGCYGISRGKTTENAKVEYYEHKYVEEDAEATYTYLDTKIGDYYFSDGIMLPGVNTGDGFAKIERVKPKKESTETLKRRNTKLNGIRYIKECTSTPGTSLNKIVVVSKGITIEKSVSGTDSCKIVDLDYAVDIDEIAVFHTNSGIDYKDSTISVSSNNVNWTDVKGLGTNTQLSETETVTGYRVSAYQYDITSTIPTTGTYIIQPVLSENKVLTASATADENANPITIEPYSGEKRQRWTIELIRDTKLSPGYIAGNPTTYEYKITEMSRYKTLAISQDENIEFNTVSAINKFNEKARNEPQIWRIIPVGNGTYKISTAISSSSNTGNLIAQTNSNVSDAYNQIIIGKNNDDTARFKLIQIDYSGN